jgi:F-type H+-transporting ATPase subunit gamma
MANIKALALRITSTQGIEKITKSMKMVAAAKLRGDEERFKNGRTFAESALRACFPQQERELNDLDVQLLPDKESAKQALLLISSDRGLCGGVNSSVCKTAKLGIADLEAAGKEVTGISIVGDKARAQMNRLYGDQLEYTMTECWQNPINFSQASAYADRVLSGGKSFDSLNIIYNTFVSAIQYDTTIITLPNLAKEVDEATAADPDAETRPAYLKDYELEPESEAEAMQNMMEFGTAAAVFGTCIQNATSEQSSRMSAMDNASSNAADMVESLQLQYNRARQMAITTELCEIIAGASAL